MAKNVLKYVVFSFLLMRVFALGVYADIAPDPVTRAVSILPFVLKEFVEFIAVSKGRSKAEGRNGDCQHQY